MSIDPELLAILVCPADRTPLVPADADALAALNGRIVAGGVTNGAGQPVERPLEAALVRADGAVFYPIRDGIPVLLVDEAILAG